MVAELAVQLAPKKVTVELTAGGPRLARRARLRPAHGRAPHGAPHPEEGEGAARREDPLRGAQGGRPRHHRRRRRPASPRGEAHGAGRAGRLRAARSAGSPSFRHHVCRRRRDATLRIAGPRSEAERRVNGAGSRRARATPDPGASCGGDARSGARAGWDGPGRRRRGQRASWGDAGGHPRGGSGRAGVPSRRFPLRSAGSCHAATFSPCRLRSRLSGSRGPLRGQPLRDGGRAAPFAGPHEGRPPASPSARVRRQPARASLGAVPPQRASGTGDALARRDPTPREPRAASP